MLDEPPPSEEIKTHIKKLLRKLKRKEDVLDEGITIMGYIAVNRDRI